MGVAMGNSFRVLGSGCYSGVRVDSRSFMGVCGSTVVTQHGTCVGTGHMDVTNRGHS
jgi:hypothetical protein